MFDIGTGTMLVRSRVSQERDLSWISKNRLHTFVRFKIAVWSCVENAVFDQKLGDSLHHRWQRTDRRHHLREQAGCSDEC